jgi:hypothetical protein
VGPRSTFYFENFEGGGAGWTHGGTLDEWQCDAPTGLGGDPPFARSGTKVYGTDLSGLGANPGRYEKYCNTYLESPPIDCSRRAGVVLRFWRWLTVEKSQNGVFDVARVQVNGTTVWENPSASNLLDPDWTFQEMDVSSLADGNPAVRVRFTLKSDGVNEFGGWNLDDVVLSGISTVTTTDGDAPVVPRVVALHPAVPNPCNPSATLRFEIATAGPAELAVYDARGHRVRTLVRQAFVPGAYRAVWDGNGEGGTPCASGVYFCRLVTPDAARSQKLVLVR